MRTQGLLTLLLAGMLTGCWMIAPDPAELIKRYQENPHPVQAYEVRLTIADAPGPFVSLHGYATYEIEGETCLLPRDNNLEGAQLTPKRRSLPVQFAKISETEYVTTVYADGMLDADYFGRGVCHWYSTGTHVRLKATGADGEAEFIAGLSGEELSSEAGSTTYLQKKFYPIDSDIPNMSIFGQTDRTNISHDIKDSDLFTLSLTSRKTTP